MPGDPQSKKNLISSIANQAAMREGERSKMSLYKLANESSSSLSGSGLMQKGFGPGKKLGAGKWKYANGKWQAM